MDSLAVALIDNPLIYIAYALILIAIIGFGLWVQGFEFGLRNLITQAEESHHVEHAHTHGIQGLYILMTILGIWEILRIFFYNAPGGYWWLVAVLLGPVWVPLIYRLFTSGSFKKKGGGH